MRTEQFHGLTLTLGKFFLLDRSVAALANGHIREPNTAWILPHLLFVARTFKGDFSALSTYTRSDLCLSLLEASQLAKMEGKRDAIICAQQSISGIDDWYLSTRLAAMQCVLHRVDGHQEKAVSLMDQIPEHPIQDQRISFAAGQIAIQRALNSIQREDLESAVCVLENWTTGRAPSLMEQVVVFRKGQILGQARRYQGEFAAALYFLEKSLGMAQNLPQLNFVEDSRNLICELADTLRELDRNEEAEQHLRKELQRRHANLQAAPQSGTSLLEACLAEVLFARGQLKEAEVLSLQLIARPNIMRLGRLRFCIVLGKIYQTRCEYQKAMDYWAEALRTLKQFPLENGHTTYGILLSSQRALEVLGDLSLLESNAAQLRATKRHFKPGGTKHWIAGMGQWVSQVESESRALRSRI